MSTGRAWAKLTKWKNSISTEDQLKEFEGCVYILGENKILTPEDRLLNKRQFNVIYGGFSFAMSNLPPDVTSDAWKAFTESEANRCPKRWINRQVEEVVGRDGSFWLIPRSGS